MQAIVLRSTSRIGPPMLPIVTKSFIPSPGWVLEKKHDGIRCLIVKEGDRVRLISRNRLLLNRRFPDIVKVIQKSNHSFIVDGEIAIKTSLNSSRNCQPKKGAIHRAYLFDLLSLEKTNYQMENLLVRKKVLKTLFKFGQRICYVDHRQRNLDAFLRKAKQNHWEGVIAKHITSPYLNCRTDEWKKIKFTKKGSFYICGYTQKKGLKGFYGALLLCRKHHRSLTYVGKVHSGFDDQTASWVAARLRSLRTKNKPEIGALKSKGVTWVKPLMRVRVEYLEKTKDGKLREPRLDILQ